MKNGILRATVWSALFAGVVCLQAWWPQEIGRSLAATVEAYSEPLPTDGIDEPDVARVAAYGCLLQWPVVVAGKAGWRVVVWADYEKTGKDAPQAHPPRAEKIENRKEGEGIPAGEGPDRGPEGPAEKEKARAAQGHDWEKWLSFRAGKNADKKADEDCREWRRALAKKIENRKEKIADTKTRAKERRKR